MYLRVLVLVLAFFVSFGRALQPAILARKTMLPFPRHSTRFVAMQVASNGGKRGGSHRVGGSGRGGGGRGKSREPPPLPPIGSSARGQFRSLLPPGTQVEVIKKEHQRCGTTTTGIISRSLGSSAHHHRGIKVMLESGVVGRVHHIHEEGGELPKKTERQQGTEQLQQRRGFSWADPPPEPAKKQTQTSEIVSGFNTMEIPPEVLERLQRQFRDKEE
mmetsp:Transcript_25543/g.43560  ORF Transcript_25543/g.43560 Transcript_25543/m.43560 type:complete len:217 (+) Transcript_25543:38-688(+)